MSNPHTPLIPLIQRMRQPQQRAFVLACAEGMLPLYLVAYPDQHALTRGLALLKLGRVEPDTRPRYLQLLETCWSLAFRAEEEGSPAAWAAFVVVDCLELELMEGSLIMPVMTLSANAAHAWVRAKTPYREAHPGYAATYLQQLQQQRSLAEKILRH